MSLLKNYLQNLTRIVIANIRTSCELEIKNIVLLKPVATQIEYGRKLRINESDIREAILQGQKKCSRSEGGGNAHRILS